MEIFLPLILPDHEISLLLSPLPILLCSPVLSPEVQTEALCPLSEPCPPWGTQPVSVPILLYTPRDCLLLTGQQEPLPGDTPSAGMC